MKRYIVLEKCIGQTPLETLQEWKRAHPEYANVPASYAGRLDPMASGKLLILLGDECKKQEEYTGLDKEYEIEVLLDLSTDTGDVLGLPAHTEKAASLDASTIDNALRSVTGSHTVPYPAFSSKTVNGKPLFLYTLEGTLDTITIPEHEETIYRIKLLERSEVEKADLARRIDSLVSLAPRSDEPSKKLGADFRQYEIRAAWKEIFNAMPERSFMILRLRVTCVSGTYMRTLASRIATELDTTALALSIHRTRIGRCHLPFGFWLPTY
ncbi:MAG: hypothetical protein V4681_03045 [Patescibacteria group bacterium]